jgi:hypothetical protein
MTTTKLTWIILGLTAFLVLVSVTVIGGLVLLNSLGIGDSSISVSTPTTSVDNLLGNRQISGLIWHDLCASGVQGQPAPVTIPEGCLRTADGNYLADGQQQGNEPGIAGVHVRLGLGECPAVGLVETVTSVDGRFSFTGLKPDRYCVSIDPGLGENASVLLPGAWTSPLGATQAMQSITLVEGALGDQVKFGWDYQFLPLPPTVTATATTTSTPTATPTPTMTPTPETPCDWVGFITDVTVPDGTVFKPDQDFRKTWRLKNLGTCTWTKDYDLVYVSGDRMTGDSVTPLKTSVAPGQTIDISIELTAPIEVGKHTGYWALRNAAGTIFGLGPQAKNPFWVIVRVEKPKSITYDLSANYCDATWRSGAGTIECPSGEYDVAGYIERLDAPVMEEGRVENEAGLWVIPEGVDGGYLSGTFPAFEVKAGDRFRTVVSCLDQYKECDVQFRLEYQIGDGDVKTLGKWNESYEGGFTAVDVDLTPLAGKDVKFILTIRALEEFDQDSGLWLHPSIWR